jgi:hypothetical protein
MGFIGVAFMRPASSGLDKSFPYKTLGAMV